MRHNPTFEKVYKEAVSCGDRGACAMIAISIVTDLPYPEIRELMVSEGIWDSTRGRWVRSTGDGLWKKMLSTLGLNNSIKPPKQSNGSRYSMATIGKAFPIGRYLVRTNTHVAAMVDGEVLDWTAGRRHIPILVYPIPL